MAGDEGGAQSVAVFEDLKRVVLLFGVKGLEPQVVEHRQIGAGHLFEKACAAAVAPDEGLLLQERFVELFASVQNER
jgi:hypothetical protein